MSTEVITTSIEATRWRNPTSSRIVFELTEDGLALDHVTGRWRPRKMRTVIIEPGAEAVLPAHFDNAIQTRNPDGYISAGLAPQLLRVVDGTAAVAPVHPALTGATSAPPRVADEAREARLRARRGAK